MVTCSFLLVATSTSTKLLCCVLFLSTSPPDALPADIEEQVILSDMFMLQWWGRGFVFWFCFLGLGLFMVLE